ncbi:MAG: spore cortex biosynthesis protein YabQ [Clostridia bacterium]|nr:spore cortex biosynthesis protein YabQ [Clostridia bacterium]
MTDANQIYIFLVCVLCGIAGGVFYDFFYCIRYPFKNSWVRIATDVVFCIAFGGMYLFVSAMMGLPNLRLYTFVGCILGIFLYIKSFHKIVAFFLEKVYNRVKLYQRDRKSCPPKKKRLCRKRKESESLPQ